MARIFYSMSGEGRGHATRVRAIVDALRDRHEITLFAPGDAYDLLAPAFKGSDIRVHRIPGLRFYYTAQGTLDYLKTACGAILYLARMPALLRRLRAVIRKHRPDVIITDFEPALPRAARQLGVPFISLNHQHFLIVNDLGALPLKLRFHAWLMSFVVRAYYRGQALTMVSSFYFPPLKSKYRNAIQLGVILRPSVIGAPRGNDGHLAAYVRRFATDNVLGALRDCGRPVKLYGLGAKPRDGMIEYCEISEEGFLRDLGTCDALICTAGNQLVGEALYLGKPVFAFPEPKNQEQYINAHFLAAEGVGEWCGLKELSAARLRRFLANVETYRARIDAERYNGNLLAIEAVEKYLSGLQRSK